MRIHIILLAMASSTILSGCFIFKGKNKCDTCPNIGHHSKHKKNHK